LTRRDDEPKEIQSVGFFEFPALILALSGIPQGRTQDAKTQYPNMARLGQYLLRILLMTTPLGLDGTPATGVGSHG
jgi:hypothetical protein